MLIAFSVDINMVSRKKRYTIDSIMYATEIIIKETVENNFVTAAFLDLTKSFESIIHQILSIKLDNLGFDIPALKLIGSFLSDRVQSVVLNDILSENLSVEKSVPQDTVLGPLLFYLYINETTKQLIHYADDTLFSHLAIQLKKAKTSSHHVACNLPVISKNIIWVQTLQKMSL